MTCDTIIVGSHVVLPTGIIDKNIVLDEGKIIGFTNDIPSSDRKINADGLVAIPGVIDTHVHYGVYSPIEHAAVSESHAAAIGGITTMMRMLRRGDSYKNSLSPQLNASSKSHYVDYAIHASIFNSKQVDEMQYCVENGVTSFKLYMNLGGEVGHVYMDMEPGKNLLQEERVEVTSEIVEKVVSYLDRRLPSMGKTVELSNEIDSEININANGVLISWAIENVIKNGMDAVDNNGKICVKLRKNFNNVVIQIADSGKGISRKNWRNIFRPGYSTKEQGWGLGLSLTSRIIKEIHGGSIRVAKSEIGDGTTIEITLPQPN